jgi:hypothetical protein
MSGIVQPAQTGSMLISAGQAAVSPIGYGYYPEEGSRCVSAQYNWTTVSGFADDLSQLLARGVESTIQTVYIENGSNAQSVTLTVAGTDQVITCPALSQGFFPAFFTGQPSFQITTSAPIAAVTRCYFLNMPIAPAVWHV